MAAKNNITNHSSPSCQDRGSADGVALYQALSMVDAQIEKNRKKRKRRRWRRRLLFFGGPIVGLLVYFYVLPASYQYQVEERLGVSRHEVQKFLPLLEKGLKESKALAVSSATLLDDVQRIKKQLDRGDINSSQAMNQLRKLMNENSESQVLKDMVSQFGNRFDQTEAIHLESSR